VAQELVDFAFRRHGPGPYTPATARMQKWSGMTDLPSRTSSTRRQMPFPAGARPAHTTLALRQFGSSAEGFVEVETPILQGRAPRRESTCQGFGTDLKRRNGPE